MPMPFGWFQVAWSDELTTGESKPLYYFGRHLVAWRDESGEAHVWDAFCPHLGAHLGFRATICGDEITCPLHGWKYGPDGRCTDIPYSDRLNRSAQIRTFPVLERNGTLLAWYHPDPEQAPMWEPPELAEFGEPDFVIYNAGRFPANRYTSGMTSKTSVELGGMAPGYPARP